MSSDATHRVGRPLDVDAAQVRAAQAAALGDLLTLRVLSAIAVGEPASTVPALLHADAAEVRESLRTLEQVGILRRHDENGYALPAESWVRFGRLLAGGTPALPDPGGQQPSMAALPPAIETVARDLSYRFASTFSSETVSQYVVDSYLLLSQRARMRAHLPALTARYAADRLDALASARGLVLRGTPEVLFVCVQNAGRSQMAAAYLRHLAGGAVHVRTAGSAPASEVHPSRGRGVGGGRGAVVGRLPEAVDQRGGAGGGLRHHDGVWRCVSGVPGAALHGLGSGGPAQPRR